MAGRHGVGKLARTPGESGLMFPSVSYRKRDITGILIGPDGGPVGDVYFARSTGQLPVIFLEPRFDGCVCVKNLRELHLTLYDASERNHMRGFQTNSRITEWLHQSGDGHAHLHWPVRVHVYVIVIDDHHLVLPPGYHCRLCTSRAGLRAHRWWQAEHR